MHDLVRVRRFCLDVIKDTYGYSYDPDWHADLDSLLQPDGVYSVAQGGHMTVKQSGGVIAACGGLRSLRSHRSSHQRFKQRYSNKKVGALWRIYVAKPYRQQGLGTGIVAELEGKAHHRGYQVIYLHTSWRNPDAVAFWRKQGYVIFQEDDNEDRTVHMEKCLLGET